MALINLTSLGIFAEPKILYTTEYRSSMAEPTRLRIFTERTVKKTCRTHAPQNISRTNERTKKENYRTNEPQNIYDLPNERRNLPNNEPQYMYRTDERKWKLAKTTSLEVLNLPNERRLLQCYQAFLLLFVETLHRYQPA